MQFTQIWILFVETIELWQSMLLVNHKGVVLVTYVVPTFLESGLYNLMHIMV